MDSTTKMNIIIASISALGTLAAAIIYYYTLHELKKQRVNTYKPHLFIDKIYFHVQAFRKGDLMFPSKWSDNHKNVGTFIEFSNQEFGLSEFALKCYNIGFGTAKKISISFSYDIDAFIDEVNMLNEHTNPDCKITVKKEGYFVSFDLQNPNIPYSNRMVSIEGVLTHYLSYSLPVNVKSEPSFINLPVHFLELLNVYVFLFSSIQNKRAKNIEINIPIITANVNYQDISNRQYSKSMTITAEMSSFSTAGYSGQFQIYERE